MPGLFGAIVSTGGVTALGAAGIRKVGDPAAVTRADQVHLGSCTKAMTATLIAQLFEAGRLSLDTRLADALPQAREKMRPDMAAVTVTQLLNHRSGLPADVAWPLFEVGGAPVRRQRLWIAEKVLAEAPLRPPGEKFSYSNVGYMLLGAILEAHYDQSWEQIITDRLFNPLGMASAGFGAPGRPERWISRGGTRPLPVARRGRIRETTRPRWPAGRVHCSMSDWGQYIASCLTLEKEDGKLLKAATQKQMLTPVAGSNYMSGWMITERAWAGGRTLTHAGSNTAWFCVAWLAPLKGFAVLAATNIAGEDAAKACDDVASGLIRLHSQPEGSKPQTSGASH